MSNFLLVRVQIRDETVAQPCGSLVARSLGFHPFRAERGGKSIAWVVGINFSDDYTLRQGQGLRVNLRTANDPCLSVIFQKI